MVCPPSRTSPAGVFRVLFGAKGPPSREKGPMGSPWPRADDMFPNSKSWGRRGPRAHPIGIIFPPGGPPPGTRLPRAFRSRRRVLAGRFLRPQALRDNLPSRLEFQKLAVPLSGAACRKRVSLDVGEAWVPEGKRLRDEGGGGLGARYPHVHRKQRLSGRRPRACNLSHLLPRRSTETPLRAGTVLLGLRHRGGGGRRLCPRRSGVRALASAGSPRSLRAGEMPFA